MVHKNSQLMPNFPPEGMGPGGVPIGQPVPGNRKKKMTDTAQYPAYLGQPSGAF